MAHKGEDFYELYVQSVYRYLFSLIGEADTAEELTQETFCQALKSMNTYRGDSTPQVWLCAIAKRLWFKETWVERQKEDGTGGDVCPATHTMTHEQKKRGGNNGTERTCG